MSDLLEIILLLNNINASIKKQNRVVWPLRVCFALLMHSSALCPCPLQILLAWDGRGQPASAAGVSAAELISV